MIVVVKRTMNFEEHNFSDGTCEIHYILTKVTIQSQNFK